MSEAFAPSPAQLAAIEAADGPVLVLTGPGAGKTYCLIERIRRLIRRGVEPSRICALTFTNKAAEEVGASEPDDIGVVVGLFPEHLG